MRETHKRTIARAISYRIAALIATAFIIGLTEAVFIHIILTVIYYLCERLWLLTKWGMIDEANRSNERSSL